MSRPINMIQHRFKGCLVGNLVGDCVGAPFEYKSVNATSLVEHLEALSKPGNQKLRFTDDTAMTKSTCKSLNQNRGLDAKHLAREYTESYFKDPTRGYGAAVRQVFTSLRDTKYQDPYGPAANQFNGSGSFGNGAAMRCSGIALFAYKNKMTDRQTIDLVDNCSRITHSHTYGINGAVLLVSAIKYLLSIDEDSLDDMDFLNYLIRYMGDLEIAEDSVFTNKLTAMKEVIEQMAISGADVTQREIVALLGNDVSAQNSVPLAIYSFLRGNSRFTDSYRLDNEFMRTLHWAVSCGGDTDTIASMACGLSGAYSGINKISEDLYKKCENWEEVISLADQMAS